MSHKLRLVAIIRRRIIIRNGTKSISLPNLRLGDLIIIIIIRRRRRRNGAKTISHTNFVWVT